MTRRYSTLHRAVTLTELLVVLLIISLLATIALPVYLTKAQQAKIVTAKQETRELAHAEEQCALLHGFYVPLQMLDDLIYNQNIHRGSGSPGATDDLFNENQQIYLIDPFKIVEHSTGAETQPRLEDRDALSTSSYHARIENMYSFWGGPFINFHRDFVQQRISAGLTIDESLDFPLDPWGQPYRFYSPMGLIGSGATNLSPDDWDNNFSNGQLDYGSRTSNDRFDRFAIVSFGPDGESDPLGSGETTGQTAIDERDDDIFYLFSGFFNESSFRVFY